MSGPEDAAVAQALEVLPGIFRLLAQAAARPGQEPLTLTQFRLLWHLEHGRQLTSELAAVLGVTPTTVSVAIDGLVRRGLVERQMCAGDRRTVPLAVTAGGHAAVRAAQRRQERALQELAATLEPEERKALATGIAAIARAMGCKQTGTGLWEA